MPQKPKPKSPPQTGQRMAGTVPKPSQGAVRKLVGESYPIEHIQSLPLSEWLPDKFESARQTPIGQTSLIYGKNKPEEEAFPVAAKGMYTRPQGQAWSKGNQPTEGPIIQLANETGGTDPQTAAHEAGHAIWTQEGLMPLLAGLNAKSDDPSPAQGQLTPAQIVQWKQLHIANPNASAIKEYPTDPSHSFAEAVGYFVYQPEQLKREAPNIYNYLRDLFGLEYSRRRSTR